MDEVTDEGMKQILRGDDGLSEKQIQHLNTISPDIHCLSLTDMKPELQKVSSKQRKLPVGNEALALTMTPDLLEVKPN